MVISLTAFQRPELLEETLNSFRTAVEELDEDVILIVRVEPSEFQDQVLSLFSADLGCDITVTLNDERLGLQRNTLLALKDAWAVADELGDDFVLHLEDDLLIAADGLRVAAWMRDHYRDDPGVAFVALTQTGPAPSDPDAWLSVGLSTHFECHIWGTWRPVWEELLAEWPHDWPNHWAQRVNDSTINGRLQARPLLSRSRSIGVYGQHCNPHYHATHNPDGWAADVKVPPGAYREQTAVSA